MVQIEAGLSRLPTSLVFSLQSVPIDATISSSIREAAEGLDTTVGAVAYSIVVDTNLGEQIDSVAVSMEVARGWTTSWALNAIRIIRLDEQERTQVLATTSMDDGGQNIVFRGISPEGFSIFSLAALALIAPGDEESDGVPRLSIILGAAAAVTILLGVILMRARRRSRS